MGVTTIEWAHYTFNPWRGCTKVSAGCTHCYAEVMSKRNPEVLGVWGRHGRRAIAAESYWKLPLRWNTEAAQDGERRRVFCASLADVFEGQDTVPSGSWELVEEARTRLYELIVETPHLDWLLLTKRPQHIPELTPDWWWDAGRWPANCWIGTSVEHQAAADERIPHLLEVPASVRFLSCEPLLGPVDLGRAIPCGYYCDESVGHVDHPFWSKVASPIHWVICGGESGPNARPMHPAWAQALRDQCQEAGVPYFFKQWGVWVPSGWKGDARSPLTGMPYSGYDEPTGRSVVALPDGTLTDLDWNGGPGPHLTGGRQLIRLSKAHAGRQLDGHEWNEVPGCSTTPLRVR